MPTIYHEFSELLSILALPFEEQVLCNYVEETNIFIPGLVSKRRAFLLVIQLFASKKGSN